MNSSIYKNIRKTLRDSKKLLKKYRNISKNKIMATYLSAIVFIVSNYTTVLAADNRYVRNFSDWGLDGLQVFGTVWTAYLCVKSLMKRKFVEAVSTGILCAVIVTFLFKPELFKTIGEQLVSIVFG